MGTSDDKRRKVAQALRGLDVSDIEADGLILDDPTCFWLLLMRILDEANDYRPGLHYFPSHFSARAVVDLFADLIDRPTCNDVGDGWTFHCSACGCNLDIEDREGEPTMWLGGSAMTPRYCPNCGAVVTDTLDASKVDGE